MAFVEQNVPGSGRGWSRARRRLLAGVFLPVAAACGEEANSHLLNLSLEELGSVKVDTVFAASKFSEKVTDAPSSVTIVTRDEIQRFGYRTLGEVVRSVRSFDVMYDRNYGYAGVRGFNELDDYGSHILLLVDGHRMNDPLYETAAIDTDAFVDLDLIERVEFIRGPGSAIYGSNAFLGVINVITRSGGDIHGAEASASYGSFNSTHGRFTLGKKFTNGVEVTLSGTDAMSEGQPHVFYPEFKPVNHGLAENRDGGRFWSLFGSVKWADFTLEGGYVNRTKNVPTASYGSVFNDLNTTVDARGFADLRYHHDTDEGWGITARAFYDSYDFHQHFAYDYGDGLVINDNPARARWWGAEAELSRTFFNRFRFTMGVDFRKTLEVGQRDYDLSPFLSYVDVHSSEMVVGTYADAQVEVTKKLKLDLGARYDHYDTFGSTVNPRAALIYKPWADTALKLLYGRAFRAPNAYQLDFSGIGFSANPALKPETVDSYEFAAEHYFASHWRASASVFDNRIHDVIRSATDPADGLSVFTNAKNLEARGVEAEIEGKWDSGLLVRASYTHQQTSDLRSGARVEYSPENVARVQLSVPVRKDLFASAELIYAGNRVTLARAHTGDMWLLNATLFDRVISQRLEISASVYNVLDQRYSHPSGSEHIQDQIEQDGRTFLLKLNYKF